MAPVRVELRDRDLGMILSVPKAYFRYSWDRGGAAKDHITIDVVYPDMTPLKLTDVKRLEDQMNSTDGDPARSFWIRILVQIAPSGSVGRLMDNVALKLPQVAGSTLQEDADFVTYQLSRARAARDYLVPRRASTSRNEFFDCISFLTAPQALHCRIGCTAYIEMGDRLMVKLIYRRSYLGMWRDIDAKAKSLIRSFVIGCFESNEKESVPRDNSLHDCVL
jgi:hypothetical protein